jgi:Protein of unknown function (DUF2950)
MHRAEVTVLFLGCIASLGVGKHDGLHWETSEGDQPSPLGEYRRRSRLGLRPKDYVINGNRIAGYALVAYLDKRGSSGVMTFIINQQGRVYKKQSRPERRESRCRDDRVQSRSQLQACQSRSVEQTEDDHLAGAAAENASGNLETMAAPPDHFNWLPRALWSFRT